MEQAQICRLVWLGGWYPGVKARGGGLVRGKREKGRKREGRGKEIWAGQGGNGSDNPHKIPHGEKNQAAGFLKGQCRKNFY